jgi:hypothetical protein
MARHNTFQVSLSCAQSLQVKQLHWEEHWGSSAVKFWEEDSPTILRARNFCWTSESLVQPVKLMFRMRITLFWAAQIVFVVMWPSLIRQREKRRSPPPAGCSFSLLRVRHLLHVYPI